MFAACLGLTAAELAAPDDGLRAVTSAITRIAAQSGDAYVAREILASPVASLVPRESAARLCTAVLQSGLGRPLTPEQGRQLAASARIATSAIEAGLRAVGPEPGTQPERVAAGIDGNHDTPIS